MLSHRPGKACRSRNGLMHRSNPQLCIWIQVRWCSWLNVFNALFFQVQSLASEIGLIYNLCLVIPSLLLAPLWGPWTDRGGKRKPALQFAILGACLEMIVTLLVMYFKWSVYVLFLSATISGFSGFATVLMVGATAYIADITEKEERAFRIGEKPTVTRSVAKTKLDKINSISQNF